MVALAVSLEKLGSQYMLLRLMNGFTLCRRLEEVLTFTPVVFMC